MLIKKQSMSEGGKKPNLPEKRGRSQYGCYHVYLRGNGKKTVFYDNIERAEFLKRCQASAEKNSCKILAFAIMDNHVHLQIICNNLTQFVKSLLIGYVRWYNNKNGLSDKLFRAPFGSAGKYSDKDILESIMYIISNPVRANICKKYEDFKWTSFECYFNKNNPFRRIIEIDTDFVESLFETKTDFIRSLNNYNADVDKIRKKGKDFWPRETYINVMEYLNTLLKGRSIYELSKEERNTLIIKLRRETGASYWQIASLTHESYAEVRRILI